MPEVVQIDVPGGTATQYEKITAKVFPDGRTPDWMILHVAGPVQGAWRVINVVNSREEFERFAREELAPAAQEVGDPPGEITFFPVHNLILG